MKAFFPILLTLTTTFLFAQNNIPVFDGVVSPEEWQNAQEFLIGYEIEPGDNSPAPKKQLSLSPIPLPIFM